VAVLSWKDVIICKWVKWELEGRVGTHAVDKAQQIYPDKFPVMSWLAPTPEDPCWIAGFGDLLSNCLLS
jgi:hypothetical protein